MLLKRLPPLEDLEKMFEYSIVTGELRAKGTIHRPAGTLIGAVNVHGYLTHTVDYQMFFVHRIIWKLVTGDDPCEMQIDHKDGNGLNNAWHNLRLATHNNNIHNQKMHRDNSVGYKGVRRLPSGRFQARLYQKGVEYNLGCYATAEEASAAYRAKELELRGEFARPDSSI